MVGKDGLSLRAQTCYGRGGLQERGVPCGVVKRSCPDIGAFRCGIFWVGVVHVEARAIGRDHIGHPDGVGIHHGHGLIALEIKAAGIAQRVFLSKVPARARPSVHSGISYHRVRGRNDGRIFR